MALSSQVLYHYISSLLQIFIPSLVRCSKNTNLLGLSGIVINETENGFGIITPHDEVKCLFISLSVQHILTPKNSYSKTKLRLHLRRSYLLYYWIHFTKNNTDGIASGIRALR